MSFTFFTGTPAPATTLNWKFASSETGVKSATAKAPATRKPAAAKKAPARKATTRS